MEKFKKNNKVLSTSNIIFSYYFRLEGFLVRN
jgi:hypothetical protein